MPEARELHVDSILSNFSVQYRNEEMLWRIVCPLVKVNKRSDKYFKYAKDNAYRQYDDKIGPKSHANEIDWAVSQDNYSVKGHALADWIPQEELDNADNPLSPERDSNDFLNGALDGVQESRVAALLTTNANFPTANKVTLSGTSQWGQSADDPIGSILTAIESCFQRANTLVFGIDTWNIFRKLPEVLDAVKAATRMQSSGGGLATQSEVAARFDVDQVLVGRGRLVTSKEGQTSAYGRIWGKHCVALYVPPGEMGPRTIAFAKTFAESDRVTMRDFDSKRGEKGAHYIKVSWNSDEKLVATDVGYLIENAVP